MAAPAKPFTLSCPGKVFIIGEYTCLAGHPSLVGALGPGFELTSHPKVSSPSLSFHENSPAGKLFLENEKLFKEARAALKWRDLFIKTHGRPIGVGSSSAQFLLTLAHVLKIKNEEHKLQPLFLVREYWRVVGSSQGLRPSGLDVLSQFLGGVQWLSAKNEAVVNEALPSWGDSKTTWVLAFTGAKEATHNHLAALKERGFPEKFSNFFELLNEEVAKAKSAWLASDSDGVGQALTAFQKILVDFEICPPPFKELLEKVQACDGVRAVKGAGAQGGDCLLILCETEKTARVLSQLQNLKLKPFLVPWASKGLNKNGD